MGRSRCCSKEGLNRGMWTAKEDMILSDYIRIHGDGGWTNLPQKAGLMRCGKSCRLRWVNYLRPDIKRGNISPEEEELIIRLHRLLGNRWSLIAGRLPGRTDNEIKNYWNSHLSKKMLSITQSQSQHNGTKNLKTRSKSASLKNYVLKPTPMRVKTAVICNLLSSPSDCRSDVFCREPATLAVQTNGIEVMCSDKRNVQGVNSLTDADDNGVEDLFNNALQVDWLQELDFDLQKTSPRSLGLLLLESEEEWEG